MQPNNQTNTTDQDDNNSFDFILKTEEPPEPPLTSRLNKKILLLSVALLTVFAVVFLIAYTNISAKENAAQGARLVTVAQWQTEIIRIASVGKEQAENEQTKQRAEAIEKTMSEALQITQELANKRGAETGEELLGLKKDPGVDEQLEKANQYKNYDETFTKVIDKKLLEYQRSLLEAENNGNDEEREIMQANYKETDAILGLVDAS